jgi:hypothetical protein
MVACVAASAAASAEGGEGSKRGGVQDERENQRDWPSLFRHRWYF